MTTFSRYAAQIYNDCVHRTLQMKNRIAHSSDRGQETCYCHFYFVYEGTERRKDQKQAQMPYANAVVFRLATSDMFLMLGHMAHCILIEPRRAEPTRAGRI